VRRLFFKCITITTTTTAATTTTMLEANWSVKTHISVFQGKHCRLASLDVPKFTPKQKFIFRIHSDIRFAYSYFKVHSDIKLSINCVKVQHEESQGSRDLTTKLKIKRSDKKG